MPKLTADYISDHAGTVHSYDSYGRQVVSAVLAKAKAQLGDGESDEITVPMEFRVTPTPNGCLLVWNGEWMVHAVPYGPVRD
jgi:hypothetical protein